MQSQGLCNHPRRANISTVSDGNAPPTPKSKKKFRLFCEKGQHCRQDLASRYIPWPARKGIS
jgi:hypothetical protein